MPTLSEVSMVNHIYCGGVELYNKRLQNLAFHEVLSYTRGH